MLYPIPQALHVSTGAQQGEWLQENGPRFLVRGEVEKQDCNPLVFVACKKASLCSCASRSCHQCDIMWYCRPHCRAISQSGKETPDSEAVRISQRDNAVNRAMEESQAKAVTPGCAGTIHFEPSAWKVRGGKTRQPIWFVLSICMFASFWNFLKTYHIYWSSCMSSVQRKWSRWNIMEYVEYEWIWMNMNEQRMNMMYRKSVALRSKSVLE